MIDIATTYKAISIVQYWILNIRKMFNR